MVRPTSAPYGGVVNNFDLTGRRAIVTGGASGLGAATARALEDAGADVTIAVRTPRSPNARPLDLADLDSVRAFADAWEGPLDILVANAGVMAIPTRQLSAQGWELQLATNYLGHFALALGLRPHLTDGARLVVVSSGAYRNGPFDFDDPQFARRPYDPMLAYAQSKTAEMLFVTEATRQWDDVAVNALSPGYIHTALQRHLDDDTMRAFGAMDTDGNLITPSYYKTPEEGAATSVLLAASPSVEGVTGRYFEDEKEAPVEDFARDPEAAERLWELGLSGMR
ncbi:SDR family NAD(P)-dependent oxidoreductase [Cryptosporangium phraense]